MRGGLAGGERGCRAVRGKGWVVGVPSACFVWGGWGGREGDLLVALAGGSGTGLRLCVPGGWAMLLVVAAAQRGRASVGCMVAHRSACG